MRASSFFIGCSLIVAASLHPSALSATVGPKPSADTKIGRPASNDRQSAAALKLSRECQEAAAHPFDLNKIDDVKGVTFDELDPEAALLVCEQAYKANPKDGTVINALARTLLKMDRESDAMAKEEQAAKLGNAAAMTQMGRRFDPEQSLQPPTNQSKDPAKAESLYQRAAELGFAPGMWRYGVNLIYVGRNCAEGKDWVWRAVKLGFTNAMITMGDLNASGLCVSRDTGNALNFYLEARARGDTNATAAIARLNNRAKSEQAAERERKLEECLSRMTTSRERARCY